MKRKGRVNFEDDDLTPFDEYEIIAGLKDSPPRKLPLSHLHSQELPALFLFLIILLTLVLFFLMLRTLVSLLGRWTLMLDGLLGLVWFGVAVILVLMGWGAWLQSYFTLEEKTAQETEPLEELGQELPPLLDKEGYVLVADVKEANGKGPTAAFEWKSWPGGPMSIWCRGRRQRGRLDLFLVHGLGSCKEDWRRQMVFARERVVTACDLRGHGASSSAGPFDLEHCSSDLAGLVKDLQDSLEEVETDVPSTPQPVVLVGHSMGCRVVMEAALELGMERVAGLILLDGSRSAQCSEEARSQIESAVREKLAAKGGFHAVFAPLFDDWFVPRRNNLSLCRKGKITPAEEQEILERAKGLPPQVGTDMFASMVGWDATRMSSVMKLLPCPVLLLQSTAFSDGNNRRVSIERSSGQTLWTCDAVKLIPDVRARLVTGVGHFLMLDAPEEVNDAIRDFLRQVEQQAR